MSEGAMVRFGAFADPHYAAKVYGNRHCQDSAAKLAACVDALAAAHLDLAVCLGDLIDSAEDREAEAGYARTMAGIFACFAGPRHWVLGNHDVQVFSKGEYLDLCGAPPTPYYSFDAKGAHFAVLDGNCHGDGRDFRAGDFSWDEAWVSEDQVEWLASDLAGAAGRPAVVLCHENLDHRLWEGQLDPHVVRNADRVRHVLERSGNVKAVVQAHYHPGLRAVQNGIPYVGLRAMVVGPGPENNAYAVLELRADGSLAVEGGGQQESCVVRGR
ncbi:MAG: metallophosphoesterase [Gemmatimonadota bacterium]